MKKLTKIMIAAAVLLCGFVVTGCGAAAAIKEQIEQTYGKWYKYTGTINVPLGNTDSEDAKEEKTLKEAEVYVCFESDEGLTVAIQSTSTQNVEILNGLASTSVDIVTGGKKKFDAESFGAGKWTALMATGYFKPSSEPKISSEPDKCLVLMGEDKNEFQIQWRKVLRNYLINLVFPE